MFPLPSAAEQLEFLENRKKQYLKAALQAKQKNDLELAKSHLRTAKGLEAMMEAARSGRPVDSSKVGALSADHHLALANIRRLSCHKAAGHSGRRVPLHLVGAVTPW